MTNKQTIITQTYSVGRYRFWASSPVVGLSAGKPRWETSVDGVPLLGSFPTLEDVMLYAVAAAMGEKTRLIAFAPVMYEALKEIAEHSFSSRDAEEAADFMRETARAAIAKTGAAQ